MPSSAASAISQHRTLAQKRARRSGSFASKQSATKWEAMPLRASDLLTHSADTTHPPCPEGQPR